MSDERTPRRRRRQATPGAQEAPLQKEQKAEQPQYDIFDSQMPGRNLGVQNPDSGQEQEQKDGRRKYHGYLWAKIEIRPYLSDFINYNIFLSQLQGI